MGVVIQPSPLRLPCFFFLTIPAVAQSFFVAIFFFPLTPHVAPLILGKGAFKQNENDRKEKFDWVKNSYLTGRYGFLILTKGGETKKQITGFRSVIC